MQGIELGKNESLTSPHSLPIGHGVADKHSTKRVFHADPHTFIIFESAVEFPSTDIDVWAQGELLKQV